MAVRAEANRADGQSPPASSSTWGARRREPRRGFTRLPRRRFAPPGVGHPQRPRIGSSVIGDAVMQRRAAHAIAEAGPWRSTFCARTRPVLPFLRKPEARQ
jgi:hypothetical protein